MKISSEPDKMKKFFSQCLISKSGKGLFDSTVITISKNGILLKDVFANTIAVYGIWKGSHFTSFEPGKEQNTTLTSSLLDSFKFGFNDPIVEFITSDKELELKSATDGYTEKAIAGVPSTSTAFVLEKDEERGMMPKGQKFNVSAMIDVDALPIPSAEDYVFVCDGKNLIIQIENRGIFTRKLQVKSQKEFEKIRVSFSGNFLQTILSNMEGDIWISLNENLICFSKSDKEYLLTYVCASQEETPEVEEQPEALLIGKESENDEDKDEE